MNAPPNGPRAYPFYEWVIVVYEWSSSDPTEVILDRFNELRQYNFEAKIRRGRFQLLHKGDPLFILRGFIQDDAYRCIIKARVIMPIWSDLILFVSLIAYFSFPVLPNKPFNILVGVLLLFFFLFFMKIRITGKFPKKSLSPKYRQSLLNAMNYAMNCEYEEISR